MNGLLWMFAIVLGIVFAITGYLKVFRYDTARNRWAWVKDIPRILVVLLGLIEILAALGLVLPALVGFNAWLTPVSAIVLALLMFMASTFHVWRKEYDDFFVNLLLLLLAAFVGYGRLILAPLS